MSVFCQAIVSVFSVSYIAHYADNPKVQAVSMMSMMIIFGIIGDNVSTLSQDNVSTLSQHCSDHVSTLSRHCHDNVTTM